MNNNWFNKPQGRGALKNFVGAWLVSFALLGTMTSCDTSTWKDKKNDTTKIVKHETTQGKIAELNKEIAITDLEESVYNLEQERDKLQSQMDLYKDLEAHKGKKIYIITEEGTPFNINYYCFSPEEKNELLKKIKTAIEEYKDSYIGSEESIESIGVDVEEKVLDESVLKEVIAFEATNPLYTDRAFRYKKAEELGITIE